MQWLSVAGAIVPSGRSGSDWARCCAVHVTVFMQVRHLSALERILSFAYVERGGSVG